MNELNSGPPASILEMGGTAQTRALLAQGEAGAYYCRLYDEALGLDGDGSPWQGPFEAAGPETAAAMWVRREWDCRHNEEVRVAVFPTDGRNLKSSLCSATRAVRHEDASVCVVRLQTKVKIVPLDICPGRMSPAA